MTWRQMCQHVGVLGVGIACNEEMMLLERTSSIGSTRCLSTSENALHPSTGTSITPGRAGRPMER